jgi:hypothetical protein
MVDSGYTRHYKRNRGQWSGLSTPTVAELAGISVKQMNRLLQSLSVKLDRELTLNDIGQVIAECRPPDPKAVDIAEYFSVIRGVPYVPNPGEVCQAKRPNLGRGKA